MSAVIVAAVPGFLRPETQAWAGRNGAEISWLRPGDGTAYWSLLAAQWALPGALLVVEHDMIPAGGVTDAMLACPRPWCASPYRIGRDHRWLDHGLGCTRFAARLKTRHPDLLEQVGAVTGDGLPAKDWRRLDVRLAQALRTLGYRPHRHRRSLHLHDYRR